MARTPPDRQTQTLSIVQALAVASQFGVTLVVSVGLGLFVGQWLDGLAHTGIVFTLIGVFAGLAAAATGTVGLYRAALRRSAQEGQADSPRNGNPER